MFKRILVATDGSPTANRGLKVALAMAKEHVATLYVLHVIEDVAVAKGFDGGVYVPAQYVDSLLASLRDAGRRTLARAEKMALRYAQRVEPLLVQTLGESVAHTILTQARKHRVELIVLGTHGRRGLARLVMGSDAEAVIREALVPVLLVRSPKTTRVHRTTAKPAHRPAKRARRTVSARVVAAPEQPAGRVRAA